MTGAHLFLIVNTSTCWKTELHLTNFGVLYRLLSQNFMILIAGSMFCMIKKLNVNKLMLLKPTFRSFLTLTFKVTFFKLDTHCQITEDE